MRRIACCVLIGVIAGCSSSGKYTPPAGQTLLIVGQDLGVVAGYVQHVWETLGGVTTYTDISEGRELPLLYGLASTVNYGSGDVNGQECLDAYPHSVLAIGLNLVDHTGKNLDHIADGTHDAAIDELGTFIQGAERPVFLRIGYEFDGPWNHYSPRGYILAFRHIVDRLHEKGVTNFVSVWQSATAPGSRYQNRPFQDWYPGDEYVDWLGLSYFVYNEYVHTPFLDFAREHHKPVLVTESAPQGYDLEESTYGAASSARPPEEVWDEWYAPFLAYVHDNADVIRAVAYINVDWNSQPMWQAGGAEGIYWGDSRIQVNEVIKARWLEEIGTDFWLHGSPELFATLGYED